MDQEIQTLESLEDVHDVWEEVESKVLVKESKVQASESNVGCVVGQADDNVYENRS